MAQFISSIGTMMQIAAVNWHVWNLTHDEVALGLVGLVRVIPIILLSLLGGVLADSIDRRKVMLFTQTSMLIASLFLAAHTLSGTPSLAIIYLMTAIISGLGAFDTPAWSALLPNLVPKSHLSNAIRMNVLLWQITSLIGPVIAGFLLAALPIGSLYGLNAISFLPVVLALFILRLPPVIQAEKREISLAALREGLAFVASKQVLWGSMLLDFFATFFASALALLPVYATDILNVNDQELTYGLLLAAPSVGATIAALFMAKYGARVRDHGRVMLYAVGVFGLATIVFGLTNNFVIALMALAVTGLADTVSMVIRGALRQLVTPDHLRGRMLSVNMIFFKGGPQLGEFEAGVLARAVSVPFSVVSGGIATVLVVGWMMLRLPALREYREQEYLADVAAAAATTAPAAAD